MAIPAQALLERLSAANIPTDPLVSGNRLMISNSSIMGQSHLSNATALLISYKKSWILHIYIY